MTTEIARVPAERDKNPGVESGRFFPDGAPHDPTAPHVRQATIDIDAADPGERIEPIWASLGFDEINWTYTQTGRDLLGTIGAASPTPFHVRPHYVFVSGSGFGLPHQGSGNVYHERDGEPFYDFTIVDEAYDAIVGAGHHVLVELGFTPRDLVPDRAYEEYRLIDSPTVYSAYEAAHWSYPPKDYGKWGGLVAALAQHCLERYGEEEVSHWLWELWNEPDIFYWRGTREEFNTLYEVTAHAVRSVLPTAAVGGPAVTDSPTGPGFLREFLEYASQHDVPLDFVSFHTKGSRFVPWRTYGPIGSESPLKQSPQTVKMLHAIRTLLRVMAEFPQFAHLPAIVDECDAGVPAHWGIYDNSNFRFQNTEYYPVFQASLMKKILDLNGLEEAQVREATTWSFYFEGERMFEGTRSFVTANGVEKPLLNAYRMFGRLGTTRLPATSDRTWNVSDLDAIAPGVPPEEIDVLATRTEAGDIALLVYRRTDDQYSSDGQNADVSVRVNGLVAGRYQVEHYRIDEKHSNAHTVWADMGSPQIPTADQLQEIHSRMGLEEFEPASEVEVSADVTEFKLELPLQAVSLLVLQRVTA